MNSLELLCKQILADKQKLREENADLRSQLEDEKIKVRILMATNEVVSDDQLKDYMKSKI